MSSRGVVSSMCQVNGDALVPTQPPAWPVPQKRAQFQQMRPVHRRCVQFPGDVPNSPKTRPNQRRHVLLAEDASYSPKPCPLIHENNQPTENNLSPFWLPILVAACIRRIMCRRPCHGESFAALVAQNHSPPLLLRKVICHLVAGSHLSPPWSWRVVCRILGRGGSFATTSVVENHVPPPRSPRIMCRHFGCGE